MIVDPGVSPVAGAARLHVSTKTLQRDFVQEFGMPYSQWLTELRLQAARVLLPTEPVAAGARRIGYASASSFVVAFRRQYGWTPGVLRADPVGTDD